MYEPVLDSFAFSVVNGASAFATASYNVVIAFVFTGTAITSISHAATGGCIKEVPLNFAELADRFTYWAEAVQTLEDLRLVPYNKRSPYQNRNVIETRNGGQQFIFSPTAMEVDDGFQVIRPLDVPQEMPGRWLVANRGPMRSHPLFESQILPALKQMHQEFMPAITKANTVQTLQPLPPSTCGIVGASLRHSR